jgi:hypothetical protein
MLGPQLAVPVSRWPTPGLVPANCDYHGQGGRPEDQDRGHDESEQNGARDSAADATTTKNGWRRAMRWPLSGYAALLPDGPTSWPATQARRCGGRSSSAGSRPGSWTLRPRDPPAPRRRPDPAALTANSTAPAAFLTPHRHRSWTHRSTSPSHRFASSADSRPPMHHREPGATTPGPLFRELHQLMNSINLSAACRQKVKSSR